MLLPYGLGRHRHFGSACGDKARPCRWIAAVSRLHLACRADQGNDGPAAGDRRSLGRDRLGVGSRPRGKGGSRSVPLALDYLAACALGIAAYIGIAVAFSPGILSSAGPRANFTFTWATIEANANIWLDMIVRDWLQLLPLAAAAAYLAARRGSGPTSP